MAFPGERKKRERCDATRASRFFRLLDGGVGGIGDGDGAWRMVTLSLALGGDACLAAERASFYIFRAASADSVAPIAARAMSRKPSKIRELGVSR